MLIHMFSYPIYFCFIRLGNLEGFEDEIDVVQCNAFYLITYC